MSRSHWRRLNGEDDFRLPHDFQGCGHDLRDSCGQGQAAGRSRPEPVEQHVQCSCADRFGEDMSNTLSVGFFFPLPLAGSSVDYHWAPGIAPAKFCKEPCALDAGQFDGENDEVELTNVQGTWLLEK